MIVDQNVCLALFLMKPFSYYRNIVRGVRLNVCSFFAMFAISNVWAIHVMDEKNFARFMASCIQIYANNWEVIIYYFVEIIRIP